MEKIEFSSIEWDKESENLLIRDALLLLEGEHKPNFKVDENLISRLAKFLDETDCVNLFLSHSESEASLIGIVKDFKVGEFEGKKAIYGTLVIADKEVGEKIHNLKQENAESVYGVSPKISWESVDENGIPISPKLEHIAIVLHPAQGEPARLKDEKKEEAKTNEVTCPKCGAKIEVKDDQVPDKCPECGSFLKKKEGEEDENAAPYKGKGVLDKVLDIIKALDPNKPDEVKKAIEEIKKLIAEAPRKGRYLPPYYYPKPYKAEGEAAEILELPAKEEEFQTVEKQARIYKKALFKTGNYILGGAEEMPIVLRATTTLFEKIIKNFHELGSKVPVFIGHPEHSHRDLPKTVGWVIDLKIEQDTLVGVLEFGIEEIDEAIEKGLIRGVSVGLNFNYKKPTGEILGTVLEHVALTPYPKLRELLRDKFEKLETYVASESAEIIPVDIKEFSPEKERIESLQLRVGELEEKLRILYEQYEREKKKTEAIEEQQLSSLLDEAIADGRILPAERPIYEGIAKTLRQAGTVTIEGEKVSWLEALRRQISLAKGLRGLDKEIVPSASKEPSVDLETIVSMSMDEFMNFLSGGIKDES